MQGRNILDGVITLYGTVHELHQKMLNGVILKNDFKNNMIRQVVLPPTDSPKKGFFNKWLAPIHNFVVRGSVAIKINHVLNEIKTITTRRSILTHGIQYSGCRKC
jgi:hypothetical protein